MLMASAILLSVLINQARNSGNHDFRGYVFIYGGNEYLKDTTVSNDDLVAPQVKDQLHISISPNPVSDLGWSGTINRNE